MYRLLTSCSYHSVKTFWTRCSGRRLSREVDAANTSEFYHTSYLLLSMSVSLPCDDEDDEDSLVVLEAWPWPRGYSRTPMKVLALALALVLREKSWP